MSLELKISEIYKTYNGNPILRNCSFTFAAGRTYALQGPNGSGKSTLFRLLALLEPPDGGRVEYREDGQVLAHDLTLRRRFTLVLTGTGIFNATVWQNVAFGLQVRGFGKAAIRDRVEAALAAVGLAPRKQQRASELSSGETKRLGIARAMVIKPEILMLDEPTANIDPANTAIIEEIILTMKQQRLATLLLITHDPAQAERLGDELLWLKNGKLIAA